MKNCTDCDAKPGEYHQDNCDVQRCPNCGGQLLSCSCRDSEIDPLPPIPWTGVWPGEAECIEFGWYAKLVPGSGWVRCMKDDTEASPDLNRLHQGEAEWNKVMGRFVKKGTILPPPQRPAPATKEDIDDASLEFEAT